MDIKLKALLKLLESIKTLLQLCLNKQTSELDRNFRWFDVTLKGPDMQPKKYVFRGLTQGEQLAVASKATQYEAEEYILSSCVADYSSNELQGTCLRLLELIHLRSGSDPERYIITETSNWLTHEDGLYEAAAISVLSGITPTYLRNCDPTDRMKCLLLGKIVFENMTGKTVEESFIRVEENTELSAAVQNTENKIKNEAHPEAFMKHGGSFQYKK